jgi:hypothetical protein
MVPNAIQLAPHGVWQKVDTLQGESLKHVPASPRAQRSLAPVWLMGTSALSRGSHPAPKKAKHKHRFMIPTDLEHDWLLDLFLLWPRSVSCWANG